MPPALAIAVVDLPACTNRLLKYARPFLIPSPGDFTFLGELLQQPRGRLGYRHLAAFPARHGVRSYTDCFCKGSLRKRQLLSDGTEFSPGHDYTYRIVDDSESPAAWLARWVRKRSTSSILKRT